jgi:hypothetical protein
MKDAVMTAFVNALKSLLSLYGLGSRTVSRRRPAAIRIGPGRVI